MKDGKRDFGLFYRKYNFALKKFLQIFCPIKNMSSNKSNSHKKKAEKTINNNFKFRTCIFNEFGEVFQTNKVKMEINLKFEKTAKTHFFVFFRTNEQKFQLDNLKNGTHQKEIFEITLGIKLSN